MKVDSYACEVCNIQRQSANHWWLVTLTRNGERVVGASVTDWANGDPSLADAHLCGVQHTLEWLSRNVLESQQ